MNKVEVKDKLRMILMKMLLSEENNDLEIPEAISDLILENSGWTITEKASYIDDLSSFVKSLEEWIDKNHVNSNQSINKLEDDCYLEEYNQKYLEAESEYTQVTSELMSAVEEAVAFKEKYSEHFKNKCQAQEADIDVLLAKAQFLKLQFFLKLYGKDNALNSHLALQKKLTNDMEMLKKTHKEAVELNIEYEKVKNDKNYCKLLSTYKELLKLKTRSEIIQSMDQPMAV